MASRNVNNLYPTAGRSTETAGNDADRFNSPSTKTTTDKKATDEIHDQWTGPLTESQQFDDEGNFERDHARSGRGNIGGAQYTEGDRLLHSQHRDENPYERNWNDDKKNESLLAELESDLTADNEKKWSSDHEDNYEGRVSHARKKGHETSGVQNKNGYGQSRAKDARYKE